MSQINLKSIIGITSITTPAGADNQLTVHSNDTTERFKIDSSGNVTATSFIGNGANLTGIDATSLQDPAGYIKIQAQDSGAVYTGIHTFSSSIDIGSNIKLGNAGIITATSFVGDGSNLTGLSGLSVANQADNRLITCTGTKDALNGEANLTYDGTSLLLGSGAVATPKVTQAGSLDLDSGGISLCIGGNENSNGRTNSSNKLNRVVTPHYTNAEEPIAMISGYSTSGQSQLFYGGGSGLTNAVTEHNFYTTANTTTTSGTKRLRIRSNGEIQIGSIDTPSASRGALAIKASTDAQSVPINLYLQESSGGEGYGVGVDGDGDLNFYNGGATSPTLEIRDDNNVAITDGNLVFASGHGIDFSATSDSGNGTMSSELLDDYEEGLWVPLIRNTSGSGTYGSSNVGSYTKIGNMVHISGTIHWTAMSGTTNWSGVIRNLPFASYSGTGYYRSACVVGATSGLTPNNSGSPHLVFIMDQGQGFLYIVGANVTGSGFTHYPTISNAGSVYGFDLSYRVA